MIVRQEQFEFDRSKSREIQTAAHDQTLSDAQRELVRRAGDDQPFFTTPASHCFYCGQKLTVPAIMWHGRTGDGQDAGEIWLHPKSSSSRGQSYTSSTFLDCFGRLRVEGGMPRPLRIEYPGARYHVMSRGDRREDIFCDSVDRELFLRLLGRTCAKTGWEVPCLLPDE